MVRRRELILNVHIQWFFLRCPGNAHYPQGAPCPGFGYRIRQAVCKLRVCLCASTFDAGISAPRGAQIGNTCVSFHAVSIHTEKVPHLPVVLPRRPHADIGTYCPDSPPGAGVDSVNSLLREHLTTTPPASRNVWGMSRPTAAGRVRTGGVKKRNAGLGFIPHLHNAIITWDLYDIL